MSIPARLSAIVAAGVCLLVAGCGGDKSDSPLRNADGVLGFVPADTPYVFATPEKMPDDVLAKLEESADSMYASYATVIEMGLNDMAEELSAEGADEATTELILSLAKEFTTLMQSENLRAAGVPRSPQMAFYGVGLLPVLRIELSNPVAFDAKIAEIEANAGQELSSGEISGQRYRYFGDDDTRVVIAVTEGYLVAALVPVSFGDAELTTILGIERPARSIADSGALAELADAYGYTSYGLGMLDVVRLTNTFVDDAAGTDALLLQQLGYDNSILSDVCRSEFKQIAGVMPRVVTGYTSATEDALVSNSVVELRPDLAAGMRLLSAPVPGLGTDHGGMGSLGVSINLQAMRDFVGARVAAYEADPYECELLAGMEATVAQTKMGLAQPLPPAAYSLKGIIGILDRIEGLDPSGQQPPTDIDARLLIASDNAPGLLAMGAMFSPELAALNVQPDGKPVEVSLAQVPPQFGSTWIAMTESAIGFSVGKGSPDLLEDLLGSAPVDPNPSMSVRLDARRYYQFMSEAVAAGDEASGEEPMSEDVQEALTQVMTGIGNGMERIAVDIVMTERGIEMPATITLAD